METSVPDTQYLIDEQLHRIEASSLFSRSTTYIRLLRFLLEAGAAGDGSLKESYIGTAFFGRSGTYDPRYDSIVRVNINRLRQRLTDYYDREGKTDPVRISIPKGSYTPCVELLPAEEPIAEDADPKPELSRTLEPVSAQVPSKTKQKLPVFQRQPRWLFGAACAVAVLALAYGVALYRGGTLFGSHRGRPSVSVLELRNLSQSPEQEWLGVAVQESLGFNMSRDNGARLSAGMQTRYAERSLGLTPTKVYENSAVQALGQQLHCDYLVVGFYMPVGDQIRIDLQLRSTRSGAIVGDFKQVTPETNLLPTVASAANSFRQLIGLPSLNSGSIENTPLRSEDALHFYSEGLRLLRQDDYNAAQEMLSRAAAAGPGSARIHAAMANVWMQMGFERKAAAEARIALQNSAPLPEEERFALEGNAYEYLNDWPHALSTYARLLQIDRENLEYALGYARVQMASGHAKDALAGLTELRKSSAIASSDARVSLLQAEAANMLSDHSAELLYAGQAIQLAEKSSARHTQIRALIREGFAWSYMGDDVKGLADGRKAAAIAEQIGSFSDLSAALSEVGQVERSHGEPQAEATQLRALEMAEKVGARNSMIGLLIGLGNVRLDAEDFATARERYQRALDLAIEIDRPTRQVPSLINLAQVCSSQDDMHCMKDYALRAMAIAKPAGDLENLTFVHEYLAQAAEHDNDFTSARAHLQEGLAVAHRSGNQDRVGFLLQDIASLQLKNNDLAGAQNTLHEVRNLRLLNRDIAVAQQLLEADLHLRQGHAELVIEPMTALTSKFTKTVYPAAEAWRLIAESYLASRRSAEAKDAALKAVALARKSPNRSTFLIPALMTERKISIAAGNVPAAASESNEIHAAVQRSGNLYLQKQMTQR